MDIAPLSSIDHWEILDFQHWRILQNDALWNVYSFFLHNQEMTREHVFLRNQGLMSEVKNKGWVTHPDCSPEREL
jgi:hypothetical protein